MSDRLLVSLAEAVEIAKGNEPAARIQWNGHDYVPASTITALQERVKVLEGALRRVLEHPSNLYALDLARTGLGEKK